jgi:hypothetical protein
MKAKRLVCICAASAVAISTTFVWAGGASAQTLGTSGLLLTAPFPGVAEGLRPYGPPGSLLARETAVLMRRGVAPARASETMELLGELTHTSFLRKLLAVMGGEYAGVWLEPAEAQLDVGVTSPLGWREAAQLVTQARLTGQVALIPVHATWTQLVATQKRWNHRLASLFARADVETSLNPQDNVVVVTLSSSVPSRERAAAEREAAASGGVAVIANTSSSHLGVSQEAESKCDLFAEDLAFCNKPITPGVTIVSENGWVCTAGPLAIPKTDKARTYLLTAGHCIQKARREPGALARPKWYAYNIKGERLEIGQSSQHFNNASADIGAIKVDNPGNWVLEGATPVFAVTAEWKKLEEKSFPVKGEEAPIVGAPNCIEGQTSGAVCGTIRTIGVTAGSANTTGLVEDAPEAGRNTAVGDSGGPVIKETKGEYVVEGAHKGKKRDTELPVYEPIATGLKELSKLNLELLTTANETRPKESAEEKVANEKFEKEEKEEEEGLVKESKEEEEAAEKEEKEEKEEKFTSTIGSSTLKASVDVVTCKKGAGGGEIITSMSMRDVVLHFLECTSSGASKSGCTVKSTNTTGAGLILTATLRAFIGTVLPSKGGGLLLLPASGKTVTTLAGNECTEETKVTGSVAGSILPTGKSVTTSKVTFAAASGKQAITDIDTLSGLVKPELVAFSVSATEEAAEEVTWGKAVEVP